MLAKASWKFSSTSASTDGLQKNSRDPSDDRASSRVAGIKTESSYRGRQYHNSMHFVTVDPQSGFSTEHSPVRPSPLSCWNPDQSPERLRHFCPNFNNCFLNVRKGEIQPSQSVTIALTAVVTVDIQPRPRLSERPSGQPKRTVPRLTK